MALKSKYYYEVNDIVNSLKILEQTAKSRPSKRSKTGITTEKAYLVQCLKCHHTYIVFEGDLKRYGCGNCRRKYSYDIGDEVNGTKILNQTRIKQTDRSSKRGYKMVKGYLVQCLHCFKTFEVTEQGLKRNKLCPYCSDGISYPNKFISSLIKQIGIEFKSERSFDWSEGRIYDIYIPSLNIIIENHGSQHYKKGGFEYCGGRTLKEEQENDRYKRELAFNNNIKYYIELDCRKSELEWIKKSIMSSELPKLLNFKECDIDWNRCEEYCKTSLLEQIITLWNEGIDSSTEISVRLDLDRGTILRYLKIGANLNLCDYDVEKEKEKRKEKCVEKGIISKSKTVYMYDSNMNFMGEFFNARVLEEQSLTLFGVKLNYKNISNVCLNKSKTHKGYKFSYIKL